MMPTLARKSANPGHMSPKFLRCAGCMDYATRRGRILREGGARKQRLLASEKSPGHSFLGSLGPARRCSRSAEQSPPESGVASTCAPSLAANQWAWLKPHPQLLAEGAAIAVALHDRCRRGHRRPRRRCNCRRRHCWRAAAAAGPPPHFCYQTAVNESQKCIFSPSQAELDMSAIFTPLMSGQTPELGLSADPGPRRPRSEKREKRNGGGGKGSGARA